MPREEGTIGNELPFEVGDIALVNECVRELDLTDELERDMGTPYPGTWVTITLVQDETQRAGFKDYSNDLVYFTYHIRGKRYTSNLWAWMLDFERRPEPVLDPTLYDCDLFEWAAQA